MKHLKLYTIIIFLVVVLVCGCTDLSHYVPIDEYYNKLVELEEANSEIDNNSVEILDLKEEVNTLENNLELSKEELIKYESLINNLNSLLKNVYYGYASNSEWISDGFTAFSMEYGERYYILTAGHCIHYNFGGLDTGLYTTIKFKNNSGDFIYPKLLAYENDYYRDYAILFSDKVTSGLDFDLNNSYPEFILGNRNLNTIKNEYNLKDGESGSPVIDLDGQVIGIATGNFVDIDLVIKAIDNLK